MNHHSKKDSLIFFATLAVIAVAFWYGVRYVKGTGDQNSSGILADVATAGQPGTVPTTITTIAVPTTTIITTTTITIPAAAATTSKATSTKAVAVKKVPPPAPVAPAPTVLVPAPAPAPQTAPDPVAPAPAPTLRIPYSESNFANDANWEATWGSVAVDSSNFLDIGANASTTGSVVILNDSVSSTNYTFGAVLDWIKGESFGLVANYTKDDTYVFCSFDEAQAGTITIDLQQYIAGTESTLATGEVDNYNQYGGTGVNVYARIQGNTGTCSFNGTTVSNLSTDLPIQPPFGGSIGFDTWDPQTNNSQIVVKNVSVGYNN